jgi:hypothetical protein
MWALLRPYAFWHVLTAVGQGRIRARNGPRSLLLLRRGVPIIHP